MYASSQVANPFGMLVDPDAITRALEGSQRLECLNRRVCRPLDRQMPVKPLAGDSNGRDAEVGLDDGVEADHWSD
jgi:hypothetical protein